MITIVVTHYSWWLPVGWLKLCIGMKEMKGSNLTNYIAFHDYIIELETCVLHD